MEGVVAVHELHIWAITVGMVLLACYVTITPDADADLVLDKDDVITACESDGLVAQGDLDHDAVTKVFGSDSRGRGSDGGGEAEMMMGRVCVGLEMERKMMDGDEGMRCAGGDEEGE
ncbi:hypothetical protein AAC387_Pa10g0650 [Persea americana]